VDFLLRLGVFGESLSCFDVTAASAERPASSLDGSLIS